ncbi:hypothetical protein GCM10009846_10210 [Agrococcus versicolor]|uniref:M23ase beta-sheet core domain-containing protein n=1 Tax=Agrococcus versicolor TaxID=501482 RepID=A0ABN3AMM1_9MICO
MARLSPERIVFTSGWGARDPIATKAGKTPAFHLGADFGPEVRGKDGVPLCAMIAGPIVRVRDQYGALGVFVGDKATRRVDLWHLASYALAGDHAHEGEVLGVMGSTGLSTGNHVHVELWENGRRVDPKPFIDSQASKAVALAPADYPRPIRRSATVTAWIRVQQPGHPEHNVVDILTGHGAKGWARVPSEDHLKYQLDAHETNHGYRPTVRPVGAAEAYRLRDLYAAIAAGKGAGS